MESNDHMTGIRAGMDVTGADGQLLGTVDRVEEQHVVVRGGSFIPGDVYVPVTAVASVEENQVTLNVPADTVLEQGWDRSPSIVNPGDQAAPGAMETDAQPFEHRQDTQHTHINAEKELLIPVVEEELTATRREVERGSVGIHKEVVESRQSIEVPVTEEEVQITRRAVDREADAGGDAFVEKSISVPVRGEEVEVEKRTRVSEEIEISKEGVTRTERVTDTVRREEVQVDDAGDIVTGDQ